MNEQKRISRFGIARRVEHLTLILSFTTLAVTGLVQKYAMVGVSDFIIKLLGGIETTRVIHHTAAAIFMVEAVYHLIVLGYKLYIQRAQASMMPGFKDVRDVIQSVAFNLGLTGDHPKMGRYNFAEKAEYWAMAWGLVMMAFTGFMMWNPIATTNLLPGQVIPAAKSAHGNEAVLAVLAIILWHFYNVHVKKWNWSMIKGTLSREEMEEEHALELESLEAEIQPDPLPARERSKRLSIFIPVSTVLSLVFIVFIYRFLTFEKTAITTIPQEAAGIPAYQRQTPTPLPTRPVAPTLAPQSNVAPDNATNWNGGIGQLFQDNCASCHGTGATAGLNVLSYAGLMKGGSSGPAILPGNPTGSLVIQKMIGGHNKVFDGSDLAIVIAWIKTGAPEK